MEGRENFRTKVISREESDTSGSNLTVVNMSSLQIISYKGDATRPPREARSPISTEAGVTWDAEGYNKNKTQLLSHSMSDCRSIRNIPPSTYDMFGLIELYGRNIYIQHLFDRNICTIDRLRNIANLNYIKIYMLD